jgi:hypothetical protein
MDTARVHHPEVLAGDPFVVAGQDHRPCICNSGWITLGSIVVDPESGEETEEYALYLCPRCQQRGE